MSLEVLGWCPFFADSFQPFMCKGYIPARVVCCQRGSWTVQSEKGIHKAQISGHYRHQLADTHGFPAVGDWCGIEPVDNDGISVIHAVLPRLSCFSRAATGSITAEQVIAANIDTVFLVSGMDHDFNVRRIERYLTLAWESGALPVIVLNKSDICTDIEILFSQVEAVASGVSIICVSAVTGKGLDELREQVPKGKTIALLGSSGVGKSSLINALLGEDCLRVQEVREDDNRGRHTTTHRELFYVPDGGMLIDTPGMRQLGLWNDGNGLKHVFDDVESYAATCRYRDCTHQHEPGCAVQEAILSGNLAPERLSNYRKLQREQAHMERKRDQRAQMKEKNRWKRISIDIRRHYRTREK